MNSMEGMPLSPDSSGEGLMWVIVLTNQEKDSMDLAWFFSIESLVVW